MDENYQLYGESDRNASHLSYSSRILFRAPIEPYLPSNRLSLINTQAHSNENLISLHTNQKNSSEYFRSNCFPGPISSVETVSSPTIDNGFKKSNLRQGYLSEQDLSSVPECRTILSESWSLHDAQRENRGQALRGEVARVSFHTSPTTICLKRTSSPPIIASPRSAANLSVHEPVSFQSSHTYPAPLESKRIVRNNSVPGGESFGESLYIKFFNNFKRRPRETYPENKQNNTDDKTAAPVSLLAKAILPAGLPTIRRMRRSRRLVVCQLQQYKCWWALATSNHFNWTNLWKLFVDDVEHCSLH